MTDDKAITGVAFRATHNGYLDKPDFDILFGRISQLEGALAIHKAAISTLEARDALMLGVRNDLQARVAMLESQLRDVSSGRER